MTTTSDVTPGTDLAAYLTSYSRELAFGTEDPATVLDRYHTPDFEMCNDGLRFDRDKLIAHAGPVRKNAVDLAVEVHDTLVEEDRVAARYTMRATLRRGRKLEIEICLFGRLAADGRLRRVDQITRTVTEE